MKMKRVITNSTDFDINFMYNLCRSVFTFPEFDSLKCKVYALKSKYSFCSLNNFNHAKDETLNRGTFLHKKLHTETACQSLCK